MAPAWVLNAAWSQYLHLGMYRPSWTASAIHIQEQQPPPGQMTGIHADEPYGQCTGFPKLCWHMASALAVICLSVFIVMEVVRRMSPGCCAPNRWCSTIASHTLPDWGQGSFTVINMHPTGDKYQVPSSNSAVSAIHHPAYGTAKRNYLLDRIVAAVIFDRWCLPIAVCCYERSKGFVATLAAC